MEKDIRSLVFIKAGGVRVDGDHTLAERGDAGLL